MPEYHICCIDDTKHIVSRHGCNATDDLDALEKAKDFCGEYEVETWEGTRLVAKLAKDGSASVQPNSGP